MQTSHVALLRQVPLFAGLDDESLEMLSLRCRRRSFGPREALFRKGDAGQTLYVIVSGRVRIETLTPSGQVVQIAERVSGEAFGELALFDGKPRMADAVTADGAHL